MKVFFRPTSEIIADLGLKPDGEVHQWFTDTCALHMDKYVPYRNGPLAKTVVENGEINRDNVSTSKIVYNQDYASYVYYGMRKDGSHKIEHYTHDTHELAGPFWDQQMWTADKFKIIKEVQNYYDKRGRK